MHFLSQNVKGAKLIEMWLKQCAVSGEAGAPDRPGSQQHQLLPAHQDAQLRMLRMSPAFHHSLVEAVAALAL